MNTLPPPHASHLETAIRYVAQAASRTASFDLDDSPKVVVVDGKRGSGKTTVLTEVRERLSETYITLPTIRPEFFSEQDTVLGRVISDMIYYLESQHPDALVETQGDSGTLFSELQRLLRKASVFGRRTSYPRPDQRLIVDGELEKFATSTVIGSAFVHDWRNVISHVRSALETRGAYRPILITIDDPDLAPEQIPRILLDLRVLGMTADLSTVVCVNLDEVRRALAQRYITLYGNLYRDSVDTAGLGQETLDSTVESQLVKALPPQYTLELTPLTKEQRLQFRPIEESPEAPNLLDLLARLRLPRSPRETDTFANYFSVGLESHPLQTTSVLPQNPRALRALYYKLRRFAENEFAPDEVPLRVADSLALPGLRQTSVARAERLLADDMRITQEGFGEPTRVEIDWRRIELAIFIRSSEYRVALRDDTGALRPRELTLHEFGNLRGSYLETPERAIPITEAATLSLMLVQDLGENFELFYQSASGRSPVLSHVTAGQLNLSNHIKNADGRWLLPPLWDGLLEYLLLFRSWNELVGRLKAQPAGGIAADEVAQITLFFWWSCIVEIHETRSYPLQSVGRVASILDTSSQNRPAELTNWREETFSTLSRNYLASVNSTSQRDHDFGFWLEVLMLYAVHPDLVNENLLRELSQWRSELLSSVNREDIARISFSRTAKRRAVRSAGEFWVQEYLDHVRSFMLEGDFKEAIDSHNRKLNNPTGAQRKSTTQVALETLDELAQGETEQ